MARMFGRIAAAAALAVSATGAQRPDTLGPAVRPYVRVSAPTVILTHVNVIDGTGAPAVADRNITIAGGRITAVSAGADVQATSGATVLNLRGYSVMPGIVGMHDHLIYMSYPNLGADNSSDGPALFQQMTYSAPRLYLANGVTTLRTAGSPEPNTDIKLKRAIEAGTLPGPHIDVTGPYLDGPGGNLQMPELTGPGDARQTVAFWADRGVTSFKAYAHITRDELRAAVAEAHKRGLKVTGHLCSVTYEEAIAAGIDNLEHGFSSNTALDPGKKPDTCSASGGDSTLLQMAPGGEAARKLFASLIAHHVTITSTLPLRAMSLARLQSDTGPPLRAEAWQAMAPEAQRAYVIWRDQPKPANSTLPMRVRREMDLERAFVAAGGLLIAGPDPVGLGGVLPGFGDHLEIESLVEAGFTPVEAIRIATLNGATYLGRQDRIGSIAVGKNADLMVIKGDPSRRIADIEKVEIVFRDGIGFDTAKLLAAVKGKYGQY